MSDEPKIQGRPVGGGGSFSTFAGRLKDERADRLALGKNILRFGIKFLDKALRGIFPDDMVLVGAGTGIGKTQLACIAAMHNAILGKRVAYFALEAGEREIERRIKFQVVSKYVRKLESSASAARLNFMDWLTGDLDSVTYRYEEKAAEEVSKAFATLSIFYKGEDFYVDDFAEIAKQIAPKTDLMILDHLNYVDSDDQNENRAVTAIVKRIRNTALITKRPCLVMAHIRKSDRARPRLLPNIEDFHGSSNGPKVSTKAVMLAPAYDQPQSDAEPWKLPTYIQAVKNRYDSQRTRYTAVVNFDARIGQYDEGFGLGRLEYNEEKRREAWNELEDLKHPHWARTSNQPHWQERE